MRQSLLTSLLLTIILLSPPAAVWADAPDYLTITAVGGQMKIYTNKNGTLSSGIQISTNKSDWSSIPTASGSAVTFNAGTSVYLRGIDANKTIGLNNSTSNYWRMC